MQQVNAQSTHQLDEKLLATHPDQARIYIICDNARYYRNKKLTQWLTGRHTYRAAIFAALLAQPGPD